MKTTDRLFAAVKDIWDAYYEHPFVQGIKNGTLDEARFRRYIVQDYFYLIDYTRMFALGAAKAPDLDTMHMFADHCKAVLDYEMNIHAGYFGRFRITEKELEETSIELNNASYTAYMLRVAYEEDAAAICAAILACSVSYEVLAKRMIEERPACADDPLFGEWVRDYAAEAYAKDNEILIRYTNRLTEGFTEAQYRHLEEIFVTCSRFETAFWDMGWEMREK